LPEGRCIQFGDSARAVNAARLYAAPNCEPFPGPALLAVAEPGVPSYSPWLVLKRTFDALAALVALAVLAPGFLIIMLAIKLDSPGPVFYRVRRVGYRGRALRMLKFRKMHHDAAGGPLTTSGDPRLTRVGAVLARCRLDELPQLWHVLRGEMSIIGPRPEDPAFVAVHSEQYDWILSVRPGITGLSQIAYKEESEIVDSSRPIEDYLARIMPQKLIMDTLYASVCSLRLDVEILRWTLVTMLLRHPISVDRRTGQMRIRRRPSVGPAPGSALAVAPAPALAVGAAPVVAVASAAEMAIAADATG
jgi:lipopolysaccharide/colanic/teichoic acid biosynthesis glycosyltransferase